MFSTKNYKEYTVEYIHKNISELDVYRHYLPDVEINKKISSPFRKDSDPSFILYWYGNTLFFKDFGINKSGDIIVFVKLMENCNYYQAVRYVVDNIIKVPLGLTNKKMLLGIEPNKSKIIRVAYRDWLKHDIEYWNKYCITNETLVKYHVKPISHYWVDEYLFNCEEYSYAYHFGNYKYKIYQPFSSNFKWSSNTNQSIIQGYTQLPEKGELLIITKALKDVMVLQELGYTAIAPQAESIILNEQTIKHLYTKFRNIVSFMDYDNSGIHNAWMLRKLYKIQPIFLTEKLWSRKKGYKQCKDISDFIKKYSKLETENLLKKLIYGSI